MSSLLLVLMALAVFFLQFPPSAYSSTFTIRNKCSDPVWQGILSGAATPELSNTGFPLQAAESTSLSVPTSWSGSLRGCTLCTQDSSRKFPCPGKFPCPRKLPCPRKFPCPSKFPCPGKVPCPSKFPCPGKVPCPCKLPCPQACSHSYDDGTSTFICVSADYIITFCPGLSTRLNLIEKAAETKPCTYKKLPAEIKLFPAETKPGTPKKFPAETKLCSHVVRVLPGNRRLLGKLPDVNVHSLPSTSNEKSWNLDKEDPPIPPAPRSNQPTHP